MAVKNRTISNEVLEKLIVTARKKTAEDDLKEDEYLDVCEQFDGDFDVAYNLGITAGTIYHAREILDSLGISWSK